MLAILTGVVLILAVNGCRGSACGGAASPPKTTTTSPVTPSPAAVTPTPTSAPLPVPAGSATPQIVASTPTVTGRHVFIPLKLSAPADKPATTCTATVKGQEFAFACADGKYEYDAEYNTQDAVTIKVANAAGESAVSQIPVNVPFYRAVLIRACAPPPCETVSTHQAPYRNTNEGPRLGDGTQLEIDCWVEGSPYQNLFEVFGQPNRYTQTFYRLQSPYGGRYLWAPFVVDEFEQVVPGVKQC